MQKITGSYDEATGLVSVTYCGETRTFKGHKWEDRVFAHSVFAAKFKTGTKLWPMDVTYWIGSGNLNIQQGGFSNKGGARGLVGWWNPESQANSQYKGQR
jgi:hypothetical protein